MGRCYNTTVVDASADTVWHTIRDFHDLGWSANVITKVEPIGDKKGTEIGAKRILNDAFHETLLTVDDGGRVFTYSMKDGPGPVAKDAVSNYTGTVRVYPVTASDKAFVEWQSSFESSDESSVADFCNPIYAALLKDLAAHFA